MYIHLQIAYRKHFRFSNVHAFDYAFALYSSMFLHHHRSITYGPCSDKTRLLGGYEQQRRRPACASVQIDQRHCYWRFGKYHIYTSYELNFTFLASFSS